MFILKKGHQLGVYVPLRALFLVFTEMSIHRVQLRMISVVNFFLFLRYYFLLCCCYMRPSARCGGYMLTASGNLL